MCIRRQKVAIIYRLFYGRIAGVCVFGTDEDGKITIIDVRTEQHTSYSMMNPVFSALYNPNRPEFLCVASYTGLFIYDVRNMKT
jgi:hypothetical protein